MLLVILTIFFLRNSVSESCYFPQQIHGNYTTERDIITIEVSKVLPWGNCYKHKNDDYLLIVSTSKHDHDCYKCYKFNVVAENINLVYTEKGDKLYDPKCYLNEDEAWHTCPKLNDIHNIRNNKRYHEMVLYKINGENTPRSRVPCPVNGLYKIDYTGSDSLQVKCIKSELDTCPSNSKMNLRFNECNLNYENIQYECLDIWQGEDNIKFLALVEASNSTQLGFKYRCAIYEDTNNGGIKITIGNGTSCSWAKIRKHAQGSNEYDLDDMPKETIVLYPAEEKSIPSNLPTCSYPQNLLGKWIHFEITKQFMVFHDAVTQKTYKMRCVEKFHKPNRYLVYSRDQCLHTSFQCIWLEQRTPNIVEFQVSTKLSDQYDSSLCEDDSFNDNNWSTIVRLDKYLLESACPISGNFIGSLPDSDSLCANLSSECVSKGIMHYNVFSCHSSEVLDDRKYLCIGQWEHDNFVYTFTKRIDMSRYECFVGTNIAHNTMNIAESGESCIKGINPYNQGMKMMKTNECPEINNFTKIITDSEAGSDHYNSIENSSHTTTNVDTPIDEGPGKASNGSPILLTNTNIFYVINLICVYMLSCQYN